jgi:hypothetical protein
MYKQCLQDVKEKLESTEDWEATLKNQSLHNLIQKIERICMGFYDHKQEVFNLVQALRALFLYTQSKKETVEDGETPGLHRGMIEALARNPKKVADPNNLMTDEIAKLENKVNEAVKAALLISGTDKRRFGKTILQTITYWGRTNTNTPIHLKKR